MVGIGGVTVGQETTVEEETTAAETRDAIPILLGGEGSHWLGFAPEPVHGEENPRLSLRTGQKYEITWMDLDGVSSSRESFALSNDPEALALLSL
ncbi:hypothetical protein [Halomicrococcus sp. NG-SE-24]|uniref:hypothetical protein n=1 Tax=Halomicrococcus sp. NG-SE-24 TaxID=3436928 RepID=UPI003D98F5AB